MYTCCHQSVSIIYVCHPHCKCYIMLYLSFPAHISCALTCYTFFISKVDQGAYSPIRKITSINRAADWPSILVSFTLLPLFYLVLLTLIVRLNYVRSGGTLLYFSLQVTILEDQIYENISLPINMSRCGNCSRYGRDID